jgi:pimeloyl-ACP methyl ester carboxylesterase
MLTEHTLDTGTVSINYAEGPKSGPTCVLVHGITARWQLFRPIVPALAQRWHLVAMDLRGHGRSGHVPGRYGLLDYESDVMALIRHLDDGPVIVIGHSLGAMTGIALASEHPEAVRALVLEDPPLGAFSGRPSYDRPAWAALIAMRDLAQAKLPFDEMVRILAERQPDLHPADVQWRASRLLELDPDALTTLIENRAIDNFDLTDRLQRVACPTLLLHGNPDLGGALSAAQVDWAQSLLQRGTFVYLPEVGHGLHSDVDGQPARVCELIADFLDAL